MKGTQAFFTDEQLSECFKEYVDSYDSRERHSDAACKEAALFDETVTFILPGRIDLQSNLYDKMMDTAVEFEESGFIAGYRMCLKHLKEDTGIKKLQATNPPLDYSKRLPVAAMNPNSTANCISSRDIADMFSTNNTKVVNKIEDKILPYLTEEEKQNFILRPERNAQNKRVKVYWLNEKACKLYVKHESAWIKYKNVDTGCRLLREKMKSVFEKAEALSLNGKRQLII